MHQGLFRALLERSSKIIECNLGCFYCKHTWPVPGESRLSGFLLDAISRNGWTAVSPAPAPLTFCSKHQQEGGDMHTSDHWKSENTIPKLTKTSDKMKFSSKKLIGQENLAWLPTKLQYCLLPVNFLDSLPLCLH